MLVLGLVKFLGVLTICSASKILAIIPTPSYSHQIAFSQIWKDLSKRGHQVTLLTTDPINNLLLTNLTEIDLSFTYKSWKPSLKNILDETSNDFESYFIRLWELIDSVPGKILPHPDVQQLIKDKSLHFDLVIAEAWYPSIYAFAEHFKTPLILITSLDASNSIYWTIGNPVHPITNPEWILGYTYPMTFAERILSVAYEVYIRCYLNSRDTPIQDVITLHFGKLFPPLTKIRERIVLLFVNINPVLSLRQHSPSVIPIGGGVHLALEHTDLPKDVQNFLNEAKNGVIYFSLGTNVNTTSLQTNIVQVLFETFESLSPIRVLIKCDGFNQSIQIPTNVYLSNWLAQRSVLSHPNVKVFVTQGGLQSIEEALYSYVPMIGMPFFADQQCNVKEFVKQGIGLFVDVKRVTPHQLRSAIQELMRNPKYRNRMKQIVKLVQDQPMTGLERAVWWTEYVLRHKGAKHLKSPYRDLPFYQYMLLDVYAFILCVILVLCAVVYYLFKVLFNFVKLSRHNKVKTN